MHATLSFQNITLEPLSRDHRDGLFLAAQDERIWEFNIVSAFGKAFDSWFEAAQNSANRFVFVIQQDGTIIGSSSYIDHLRQHQRAEIGHTWLNPSVWATQVNTTAKYLMLTHAFETIHLSRVSFNVDAINLRSRKAVAKLGAIQEGILRQHAITHTGRVRDTVVYSILRSEWPTVKRQLEEKLRIQSL